MTAKDKDFFKAFCQVSRAFGTTLSKDKLLTLIVQSAITTMDAKAACLFLADEEKDLFVPVAQQGLSKNYLHAKPLHAKKIVKAILKGGYLAIKDATSDPRLENHAEKKAEGIASILDVPVMVQDKAIGVLALYTSETRDFSEAEIDFLTALAEQGGIAIERSRLLERIRKNSMLFLDLATNINSSLDIKNILQNLTTEMCRALGMKGAAIRLIDEDSGTLQLVASYGLSKDFLNKGSVATTKSAVQALQGETLVIRDATTDDRIQYKEQMRAEGIGSMIVTPIKAREKVIGTLRLYSGTKRNFPEETILLVNALAQSGGLAIQNASMYLKLQEDKADLEKDIWSHRSWF